MSHQRKVQPEADVFVCCADASTSELASTVVAYLRRRGFLVLVGDHPAAGAPDDDQLALVETIPDFLLLLTPPTLEALGLIGQRVHAEVARALETGRNVVLVAPSEAPPVPADAFPAPLSSLAGRTPLYCDPDRLAETLSVISHSLSSDTTVVDCHLMRRTRRLFISVAVFVLAAASLQVVPALIRAWSRPKPPPPLPPFTLYWAGFVERMEAGRSAVFRLEEESELLAGDLVTVVFSPSADGCAYVIAKDGRGRVSVLYPTEMLKGASRVRAGQAYQAPVESGWMTIDPEAGIDRIYVFAGYDPLLHLEELVEEPEMSQNAGTRAALVEQTVNGLIDGRHYQFGRRPWVRNMQLIDQSLKPGPGPATFSASLPGGITETHPAIVQPGLASALAEIKVRFTPQTTAGGK